MPNMTLSLPEDIYKIIKTNKFVNWSEIARQAIIQHAEWVETMDRLAKKSKLTEKDAEEISALLKKGVLRRVMAERKSKK